MKPVKLKTIMIQAVLLFGLENSALAQIDGSITKVGEATHVEFTGVNNWEYELKKINNKKIHLLIPKLSEKSINEFKKWNNDIVESFVVNKQSVDNKTELIITLKDGYVESFDYQVDKPSKLVVDFYIDNEKYAEFEKKQKALQAKNQKLKKTKIKKKKITKNLKYQKMDRKPSEFINVEVIDGLNSKSRKTGVYDAADPRFERFKIKKYEIKKEALIASRENIYIRFPILKLKTSFLDEVISWKPEYIVSKDKTEESKRAQLLKALYDKKRSGSFIKTYNFFVKKYPDSKYQQVIDHMYADLQYDLWRKNNKQYHYDEAVKKYQQLVSKYPESPLNERTNLLLNYTELERENSLYTIQSFSKFLQKYPKSEYYDRVKFAIAESYIQLKNFDKAKEIYNEIISDPKQSGSAVEAKYRLGDVAFYKKDYSNAIVEYKKALVAYPSEESKYSNINYNLAESLFWKGEYQESLNRHIRNLELFPSHTYNAYSLTRVGEILQILGANKEKVMAAYLESYFRFDGQPGANIARVRMLTEQMSGMKGKQLIKSLDELHELAKEDKLPKQDEFVNLMIANGFKNRNEFEKATKYLIDYYQKHPTTSNLDFFKKRIVSNIADQMNKNYESKKFIENLSLNGKYQTTWLKDNNRIDTRYFMAKAYEVAGVYSEAEKLYSDILDKRKSIVGSDNELERSVYEHLPTVDSLKLGLASSKHHNRKYTEAYAFLNKINIKNLSSNENIERLNLLSQVLEQQGQYNIALEKVKELAEAWSDNKILLSEALLKQSELENKLKRYKSAEKSSKRALSLKPTENNKELAANLNKQLGDALFHQNKKMAAVESYIKVLSNDPDNAALRYRVGNILFEQNDVNGAEQVWSKLSDSNSLYKKLAKEKMSTMKWEKDYKKYIDRIPAMSKGSIE